MSLTACSKCFMIQGKRSSKFFEITIYESDRRDNQTVDYITLMCEEKKDGLAFSYFPCFSWFFFIFKILGFQQKITVFSIGFPLIRIHNPANPGWILRCTRNHEQYEKSKNANPSFLSSHIKVI